MTPTKEEFVRTIRRMQAMRKLRQEIEFNGYHSYLKKLMAAEARKKKRK